MFADLLDSNLPPQELTAIRLQHEAITVVGAGLETTKWTLTVAFYYILADPTIHKRLREELETAIPDPSVIPSWSQLQRLPYLSACVEEGTFTLLKPAHLRLPWSRHLLLFPSSPPPLVRRNPALPAHRPLLSAIPLRRPPNPPGHPHLLRHLPHAPQRAHLPALPHLRPHALAQQPQGAAQRKAAEQVHGRFQQRQPDVPWDATGVR